MKKTSTFITVILSFIFITMSQIRFAIAAEINVPPLSVQLHSVKHDVAKDFEGTLKAIANMGFKGVEFAGRYGPYAEDPQGLKNFLDSLGLKTSGAHIPTQNLLGDKGTKTFEFFKILGTHLILIPHDKRIDNPEKINEFVTDIINISVLAKRYGMQVGYHNHAKEFNAFSDSTFWDYLASNTPENIVLQMDVGWVNYAEHEPKTYVKRYPNRTLTTHYKIRTKPSEKGTSVIIGQDNYDWAELIKTNVNYGGTQWIVIEQEEYPEGMTPLQAVKASKQGLDAIIDKLTNQQK